MLKNEDLKQISKAQTLLGMIWAYAIELDSNELYEKTGVTTKDLNDCMRALNHIHTVETLKHLKASEKANAYNKAHPEKHREINRRYEERKRNKKGGEL